MEKKQKATSKTLKNAAKKLKGDEAKNASETPLPATETSDNGFDFGGLPERNLKKNLGCG